MLEDLGEGYEGAGIHLILEEIWGKRLLSSVPDRREVSDKKRPEKAGFLARQIEW